MGCGTSQNVTFSQKDLNMWRGDLHIELKKAALQKEIQWLGKQDPYVKFVFGRQEQKSDVCVDGGQFPQWQKQSFDFKRTDEEDTVYIQVWNSNLLSDTFIGEGGFSLMKCRQGKKTGKVDQNCILYGNDQEMGEVQIVYWFDLLPECENHPEVIAVDGTGKCIVKPTKATLLRNVKDSIFSFGEMNPIVEVALGSDKLTTSACMGGGQNPKWLDELIFTRDELQRDTFMIELQNFCDSDDNDLIATGYLSLTPFLVGSKIEKTIDLYYQGELKGNIQIEAEYIPDKISSLNENQKKVIEENIKQKKEEDKIKKKEQKEKKEKQPIKEKQEVEEDEEDEEYHDNEEDYSEEDYDDEEYDNDPPSGQGRYEYPNGDVYNGNWLNGCRDGKGKCRYRIGMVYDGQWLNDIWHGEGRLTEGRTTYIGSFQNGKKSGQGVLHTVGSRAKYDGEWENNQQHGTGKQTDTNGVTREGKWDRGRRIEWLDEQPVQQQQQQPRIQYQQYQPPQQQAGNLGTDQAMTENQLIWAPQGFFFLKMQSDGKICIYRSNTPFMDNGSQFCWSNTPVQQPSGKGYCLKMQGDQNLCIYNNRGQCIWSSNTWNQNPVQPLRMEVRDNGTIGIINGQNVQVWASG